MRKDIMDSLDGVEVGCLTTDFAMQNVLIQIGIPVLSLDGMLIKRAKSFVLRCYACYKITHDTNKQFCPKCGNKTLMKVSKSIDSEGRQHYHIPNRKPFSAKGKQTSLPTPKGGKHAFNPITCEDQPQPQIRMSKKAMIRNNVFDPDYVAQNSPFITRDVTSRSALLGFAKQQRNAPQKRGNGNKMGVASFKEQLDFCLKLESKWDMNLPDIQSGSVNHVGHLHANKMLHIPWQGSLICF